MVFFTRFHCVMVNTLTVSRVGHKHFLIVRCEEERAGSERKVSRRLLGLETLEVTRRQEAELKMLRFSLGGGSETQSERTD